MALNNAENVNYIPSDRKKKIIFVSVIMITYNHESFIEEAIRGVLIQEGDFDLELIIANDASTDRTDEVIQNLLKENSGKYSINYMRRPANIGRTANFLDALKQSAGKYIAVCEGDDYWTDSSKLQKQVDFLEANMDYSMVCHDALVLNLNNTFKQFYLPTMQQHTFSTKFVLKNRHFCPTASIVFRKDSLLPYINLELIPFAGDHLMVQLLSLNGLLYRMKESMSVYRKHPHGVSQSTKPFKVEAYINKIEALKYFNKVSGYKFRRNIQIEILIVKNTIAQLKAKSKYKIKYLNFSKRVLTKISNLI